MEQLLMNDNDQEDDVFESASTSVMNGKGSNILRNASYTPYSYRRHGTSDAPFISPPTLRFVRSGHAGGKSSFLGNVRGHNKGWPSHSLSAAQYSFRRSGSTSVAPKVVLTQPPQTRSSARSMPTDPKSQRHDHGSSAETHRDSNTILEVTDKDSCQTDATRHNPTLLPPAKNGPILKGPLLPKNDSYGHGNSALHVGAACVLRNKVWKRSSSTSTSSDLGKKGLSDFGPIPMRDTSEGENPTSTERTAESQHLSKPLQLKQAAAMIRQGPNRLVLHSNRPGTMSHQDEMSTVHDSCISGSSSLSITSARTPCMTRIGQHGLIMNSDKIYHGVGHDSTAVSSLDKAGAGQSISNEEEIAPTRILERKTQRDLNGTQSEGLILAGNNVWRRRRKRQDSGRSDDASFMSDMDMTCRVIGSHQYGGRGGSGVCSGRNAPPKRIRLNHDLGPDASAQDSDGSTAPTDVADTMNNDKNLDSTLNLETRNASKGSELTDFAYRETSSGCGRRGRPKSVPITVLGQPQRQRKRNMGLVRVKPDESTTPVCRTFLRGVPCTNEFCTKRHDVPAEAAMPICSFFQRNGQCMRRMEGCPFRHVKVNPRATVCPTFCLLGFCEDTDCVMKHVNRT